MACIGTSLEECNALAGQGGGGLIVKKGIQIGQNLFQTDPGGKNLIIKQRAGKTLASINLVTGGINFGSSAEVETGFKMSGEPANSSYDTSVWSATSVIHLVEPNDPETIIGTISSVIHVGLVSLLSFESKPFLSNAHQIECWDIRASSVPGLSGKTSANRFLVLQCDDKPWPDCGGRCELVLHPGLHR